MDRRCICDAALVAASDDCEDGDDGGVPVTNLSLVGRRTRSFIPEEVSLACGRRSQCAVVFGLPRRTNKRTNANYAHLIAVT